MNLRHLVSLSLCACAPSLFGCSAEPDAQPPSPSLEEALANLPRDAEARAAVLDELYGRFPGDARLVAALRELETELTPGLLRRVERDDGRFVSFVALEGGGVVIEGGPRSLPPLTAELGLEAAEPVALWQALLPNEPVPSALVSSSDESELAARWNTDRSETVAGESGISPGLAFVPDSNESSGEIGVVREAFTENQFLAAGGCAIQPTPTGAVFQDQVPNSPWCALSRSGDQWAALVSAEVRARINVFSGGTVNLKISRDGSAVGFVSVPLNGWVNQRFFNNNHSKTTCKWVALPFPHQECTTRHGIPTPSLWRIDLLNASGDGFHIGGLWFNAIDSRVDTQPW